MRCSSLLHLPWQELDAVNFELGVFLARHNPDVSQLHACRRTGQMPSLWLELAKRHLDLPRLARLAKRPRLDLGSVLAEKDSLDALGRDAEINRP
ncbi:MAG: hypothetical protein HOD72_05055, partial [Opitutae bacterium]|nr:hypothetical protein [Opitutae bacterium]